jgi:hypothetical protein
LKSTLGVSILKELNSVIPIHKLDYPVRLKVITALATFSRPEDPWTTEEAFNGASQLLDTYKSAVFKEKKQTLAPLLGDILKTVVKPSFARTKNIAVTPAGRKNEHPVPAPRFDASVFDEASKPWKFKDVYVVTVLSWIVDQYRVCEDYLCSTHSATIADSSQTSDYTHIEAQFPFLVPPILSLIDDDGLVYKAFGCNILNRLLAPLSEAKSDILRRTNLDSVFQDALHPCLLSLPSLTPENESIRLLQSAYPALFSVIRTRFPPSSDQSNDKPPTADPRSDSSRRRDALSRILRHHLLPSYHHTSNPQPVQPTESESGIASVPLSSYPYPALTTRLFDNIAILLPQLGLHATPHLQGLIPPITETLTNPFGTAHMPLLISAATAAKELVSAGWVRIWRWRGEILGAAGVCWIHLEDDEQDIVREQAGGQKAVADLRRLLRGVVQLSRIAVEEMLREGEGIPGSREWQNDGVIDVDAEYRQFVDADERLKGLLFPDEEGPS